MDRWMGPEVADDFKDLFYSPADANEYYLPVPGHSVHSASHGYGQIWLAPHRGWLHALHVFTQNAAGDSTAKLYGAASPSSSQIGSTVNGTLGATGTVVFPFGPTYVITKGFYIGLRLGFTNAPGNVVVCAHYKWETST